MRTSPPPGGRTCLPHRAPDPADPLAPLPQDTLRAIATAGVVRAFPKNTILINEGDVGDSLYIVLAGKVKVFASNDAGREVVIDFHGPGEYVGEMSLDGAPRSASVITVEPTTLRGRQPRAFPRLRPRASRFRAASHREADPARARTTENVKSLALSDVYGRLVRLLTDARAATSTAGWSCRKGSRSRTSPIASARRAT